MCETVAAFIFVAVIFYAGWRQCRYEKRIWNNGICAENEIPWENRDTDSQGGRLYRAGNRTCWISYNVDKRVES